MTHYPPHIKPLPNTTVLLVHYTERDYICESGFVDDRGEWQWHNPHHHPEFNERTALRVDLWLPLPLIPERP